MARLLRCPSPPRRAAGSPSGDGGHQGLDLHQQGDVSPPCQRRPRRRRPRRRARLRNRAEGLATSARPAEVISKTPISSVAPIAVLGAAQDAELVAAFALECQDRVDHVLEHLGAGDQAPPWSRGSPTAGTGPATWPTLNQLLGRAAHLGDRARRGLDGIHDTWSGSNRRRRRRALATSSQRWPRMSRTEVAAASSKGAALDRLHPLGTHAAPGRSTPRRICRGSARRLSRRPLQLRHRRQDLKQQGRLYRCPGSPPISTAEPGTRPPPHTAVELGQARGQAGSASRCIVREPFQGQSALATAACRPDRPAAPGSEVLR